MGGFNFAGGGTANESAEALVDMQKDREYSEAKKLQDQLVEGQFNLLDEIVSLKKSLSKLVGNTEAEKIQNRLFMKYKKDPEVFHFEDSLDQVMFGEKVGVYQSSGVTLEGNNKQEVCNTVKEECTQYLSLKEKETIQKRNSVGKNQGAITANVEQKGEKELAVKDPELPKKYDSVEAAPDSCKKAVGETCDTVKGLIDEQFIDENFKQLSSHTINDPRTSVMGRLVESGELSNETNEAINQNIANDGEFDKIFEKTVSNRKDLTKLQNTLKLIPESKDAVPVKNITSFKEDFPDLADIAINGDEATSLGDGEKLDSSEISAYGHISENYIKIGDSPEDKAKNYSTAIKTAGANLLKNDTVIKRDTVEFKAALNSIHSDNPERQFEGLTSLITIKESDKTENAAKGAKISKRSKNSTKTRLKLTEDLDKIREEFTALKEVASSENLQKRKELGERGKKIQELLKKDTPKGGEAMSGGKHDVASSNNDKLAENA